MICYLVPSAVGQKLQTKLMMDCTGINASDVEQRGQQLQNILVKRMNRLMIGTLGQDNNCKCSL
jgi:hypothetical protein